MNIIKSLFKKSIGNDLVYPDATTKLFSYGDAATVDLKTFKESFAGLVVHKKGSIVSSYPFLIKDKNNEITEPDEWTELLKNPNVHQTENNLIYLTSIWLDYKGKCYWWLYEDENGKQLIFLPPDLVKKNGSIWTVKLHNRDTVVEPESLIAFKEFSMSNTFEYNYSEGSSLATQSVNNSILADYEHKKYTLRYFQRDGTAPLILEVPGQMNQTQWEEFKKRWNQTLSSVFKIGAVLTDNKRITQLANTVKDPNLATDVKKEIAAAYGMPLSMIYNEFQNRSTAQEARLQLFEDVIEPRLMTITSTVNKWLELKNSTVQVDYETPSVSNTIMTVNELRELENLSPVPDGDTSYISEKPIVTLNGSTQPI